MYRITMQQANQERLVYSSNVALQALSNMKIETAAMQDASFHIATFYINEQNAIYAFSVRQEQETFVMKCYLNNVRQADELAHKYSYRHDSVSESELIALYERMNAQVQIERRKRIDSAIDAYRASEQQHVTSRAARIKVAVKIRRSQIIDQELSYADARMITDYIVSKLFA